MLGDISKVENIYIACGYTDLRLGIDGLAQLVQRKFQLDPFSNSLFLFCGRRRDRIKALLWEGDGFVLYLFLPSVTRSSLATLESDQTAASNAGRQRQHVGLFFFRIGAAAAASHFPLKRLNLSNFGRIWPNLAEVLQKPSTVGSGVASFAGPTPPTDRAGECVFCVSLSAKNRMVQAPKSWYNRYKSYGAPGKKACAKNATIPGNCPGKICDIVSCYSGAASSPALYDSVPLYASPEPYNSVPARGPAFPR